MIWKPDEAIDDRDVLDALVVGRRVRQLRRERQMTVGDLGAAIGRAASQVSVIENGRRDLRVADLRRLAEALGVSSADLMSPDKLSRRDRMEIRLERIQRGPMPAALGLPEVAVRKSLSDDALEAILGLYGELGRVHEDRAATPEELRRANTEVRAEQRARDNYYEELEQVAADMLGAIDYDGGPLSVESVGQMAQRMGFHLHYVDDLPMSTRSITDRRGGRIYLPRNVPVTDPRSALLKALATYTLGRPEAQNFADLLRQRVETNYVVGALLVPEAPAAKLLADGKASRDLAVEDLRDRFDVTYETAAHRFTTLVTRHLGIPTHFVKVNRAGVITKAYENDGVMFPTDALGTVEGQVACRWWAARQVFEADGGGDPLDPYRGVYHQYTDKPNGTYWCSSEIVQSASSGQFSVSVGTRFDDVKWFRGRDTKVRLKSSCPDPTCCRTPAADQVERWEENAWPSARMHSSLLAAVPTGSASGIDTVAVYDFLDRHADDVD